MIKQLETLIKMQKFDKVIGKKNILTKELPQQLNSLKQSLKNSTEAVEITKSELDENLKDQKLRELDIANNNTKVTKYKNQLLTIETNKEYKALNSEINHLEKKNSEIDDKLIRLMEDESELKKHLEEERETQKKASDELKANEEKLEKEIQEVQKDIEDLKNKRNFLAKDLPRELIRRYGILIKNKNRKAIVFNDNNACSGCGYNIRPQVAIDIKEGNSIIYCESCGRILVSHL
ncbi:MAG: C4-type zinc ribbon domain-containing protein [Candidatus Tenebribacter burtonii]|jgi:predicted  nucleic acid-binding Zn-ribbon protein|nr:C4-type zinc ribbon domain-containing protein [Candidatus Tenebribacter burtonii]